MAENRSNEVLRRQGPLHINLDRAAPIPSMLLTQQMLPTAPAREARPPRGLRIHAAIQLAQRFLIERGLGGMSVRAERSIIMAYRLALIASSSIFTSNPSFL